MNESGGHPDGSYNSDPSDQSRKPVDLPLHPGYLGDFRPSALMALIVQGGFNDAEQLTSRGEMRKAQC